MDVRAGHGMQQCIRKWMPLILEMWCYRRILKINWFAGVTNAEALNRIHTKLHFREDMMRGNWLMQDMY